MPTGSLYDRLGGYDAIAAMVDDLLLERLVREVDHEAAGLH